MDMQLKAMNKKFGIKGHLSFRDAGDGFIVMDIDNELCKASVALQGAHLMTWQPKGEEPVIWMSPVATLAKGKSIRGGVPICWPWFGAHAKEASFPGHGFARTVMWKVIATDTGKNGATSITFAIDDINTSMWSKNVPVEIQMMIGKNLKIGLTTHNQSKKSVTIGDALHTYFAVGDVRDIAIRGLDGCAYIDKADHNNKHTQDGHVLIEQEVDRIYFDDEQDVVIEDNVKQRRICIEKKSSHSTIVWNPWIEKCKKMGDFGSDEGYLGMVCVESANADTDVVELAAGKKHELWVRYSVEKQKN